MNTSKSRKRASSEFIYVISFKFTCGHNGRDLVEGKSDKRKIRIFRNDINIEIEALMAILTVVAVVTVLDDDGADTRSFQRVLASRVLAPAESSMTNQ